MNKIIIKLSLISLLTGILLSCQKNNNSAQSKILWGECNNVQGSKNQNSSKCGKVSVPINWNNPHGDKIELNVIKSEAKSTKERLGILVVNAGGPGASPNELVNFLSTSNLNLKFDIIGIETRGTGKIKCNQNLSINFLPKNESEFYAMQQQNTQYFNSCSENSGEIINNLNTLQAAHDINAVRELLNEKEINFYGISYGTNLGATFAELYPKNIRTMLLDSVFDQTIDIYDMVKTESKTARLVYDKFINWCETNEKCPLNNEANLKEYLVNFFNSENYLLSNANISFLMKAIYHNQWEDVTKFIKNIQLNNIEHKQYYDFIELKDLTLAMSFACSDIKTSNISWDVYQDLRNTSLKEFPTGGKYSQILGTYFICSSWKQSNSNFKSKFNIDKNISTLIVNSNFDAVTPKEWAKHLLNQIPSGKIVYTNEIGHGIAFRSDCMKEIVFSYLEKKILPQNGIICN